MTKFSLVTVVALNLAFALFGLTQDSTFNHFIAGINVSVAIAWIWLFFMHKSNAKLKIKLDAMHEQVKREGEQARIKLKDALDELKRKLNGRD